MRTFADELDRETKVKAFQDAVRSAGVQLGGNVAKMEVRDSESAFAPA